MKKQTKVAYDYIIEEGMEKGEARGHLLAAIKTAFRIHVQFPKIGSAQIAELTGLDKLKVTQLMDQVFEGHNLKAREVLQELFVDVGQLKSEEMQELLTLALVKD